MSTSKANIAAGRWSRLYPGIYATFSGATSPPSAALGSGTAGRHGRHSVSHDTAAELVGLTDRPARHSCDGPARAGSGLRGPEASECVAQSGAVARHPSDTPPSRPCRETVIELTQSARTIEDAVGGWHARVRSRSRLLHRAAVGRARTAARSDGAPCSLRRGGRLGTDATRCWNASPGCRRAHGLPRADRRPCVDGEHGTRYDDVSIGSTGCRVELDGEAAANVVGPIQP